LTYPDSNNPKTIVASESAWRRLGTAMLTKGGISKSDAEVILDVLITGSLAGIDSHGVRALLRFFNKPKRNKVKIVKETLGTALMDPQDTFGPVYAKRATSIAIAKAKKCGIGCCSVKGGYWVANLFYYIQMITKRNMIGFAFVRTPSAGTAWGGAKPVFGTNPIGAGFPADKLDPIILDFATTIVSHGQTESASLKGKPMQEGWFIDKDGNTAKEQYVPPGEWEKFVTEHFLQPFGTYKGYGIALVTELMGGALNLVGTGSTSMVDNGFTVIAIDISAFVSVRAFRKEIDRYISEIKASPLRKGFSEVLVPGEREFRAMKERKKNGIPIDENSWANIAAKCRELGIDPDLYMKSRS
jgi:ureidoglycolate dehydrogenase (NAD+)